MPCASQGPGPPCVTWPPPMLRPPGASPLLHRELVRRALSLGFSPSLGGRRMLWRLGFYSQRWLSELGCLRRAEPAPASFPFLAVQCRSGGTWCYSSTAVEIQMGSSLVWDLPLHPCNTTQKLCSLLVLLSEENIQINFFPVISCKTKGVESMDWF